MIIPISVKDVSGSKIRPQLLLIDLQYRIYNLWAIFAFFNLSFSSGSPSPALLGVLEFGDSAFEDLVLGVFGDLSFFFGVFLGDRAVLPSFFGVFLGVFLGVFILGVFLGVVFLGDFMALREVFMGDFPAFDGGDLADGFLMTRGAGVSDSASEGSDCIGVLASAGRDFGLGGLFASATALLLGFDPFRGELCLPFRSCCTCSWNGTGFDVSPVLEDDLFFFAFLSLSLCFPF